MSRMTVLLGAIAAVVVGMYIGHLIGTRMFKPRTRSYSVAELHEAHNKVRLAWGMRPLRVNADLCRVAKAHAEWMADARTMSHTDDKGRKAFDRVKEDGKYKFYALAENIAWGYNNLDEVMKAWQLSPPHMKALIHPFFLEAGYGTAVSRNGHTYWCVLFAVPQSALRAKPKKPAPKVKAKVDKVTGAYHVIRDARSVSYTTAS